MLKVPEIVFLTKRKNHRVESSGLTITDDPSDSVISEIRRRILDEKMCCHDIENFGNWKHGGLLLSSFYTRGSKILVIDNTSVNNLEFLSIEDLKTIMFIAHNADHEAKFGITRNFLPYKYYCTMVSDQILMAGMEGFKFDIKAVALRRVGEEINTLVGWDKNIRDRYGNADNSFIFDTSDIIYNAIDSFILLPIYDRQQEIAEIQDQLFLINSARSRVIIPLAEAEVSGFVMNTEKWLRIAEERKYLADMICEKLDMDMMNDYGVDLLEINTPLKNKIGSTKRRIEREAARKEKLEETIRRLEEKDKTHLKSYTLSIQQLDKINSSSSPTLTDLPVPQINWSSHKQVIDLLKKLNIPIPKAKDPKGFGMKEGVGKDARSNWFVEHGDHPFASVMERFDKFKKLIHNVTSFGKNWIEKYVDPLTSKVYTIFRQAGTTTLRFASGSVDNNLINLQQIPSREGPEYRECFGTDPGRSIMTLDYKGCEIIIMIALSGDLALKELSEKPDQHSYMGTKCWRAVYRYRYEKSKEYEYKDLSENYVMDQSSPSKKLERTRFKESGVFPVVYGVKEGRVAAIQKFSKAEGKIFIETIENELPKVIAFVKSKAAEAIGKGYVIHNNRTKSRRWFTPVINHIHFNEFLSDKVIVEVESAARNTCIQGTNADIVVEAMSKIDLWKRLYKVDLRTLGQVHDEIILDCPTEDIDWISDKIVKIMERTAQNYLIPEVSMGVDCNKKLTWTK